MARVGIDKRSEPQLSQQCERRVRMLLFARYLLPLLSALCVVVVGLFYNVFALQGGKRVQLCVLRLCFNTLKSARAYMMGAEVVAGVRNFYLVLMIGAACFIVLFLLSVAQAVFAVYMLYRTLCARAAGDKEAEKRAKVLFRAVLSNRVMMWISNALVLPLALFPEFFSFVCTRFLTVSGGSIIYLRFNITAIVTAFFVLLTLALALYLRRYERAVGLDLFFIEEEEDEADDGEACLCDGEEEEWEEDCDEAQDDADASADESV
ncbi:MAG: hypothetical protein E7636_05230 [Ruminococcaceae bacterium]|nr:hypothetical protein [Oscillospiraceae bacterium]